MAGEGVMEKTAQSQILGRYMVADPDICHGKPTFRGTRILVADVLDQVAAGLAWETIIEEWRGSITQEAIAEAVRLARQALLEHAAEYVVGPTAA
jgi:uncharacterized protein (DUF433 family)